MEKKVILDCFESIPENENLAIRFGGFETLHVLLMLPENLRKKVSFIIDENPNCPASRLGIEVLNETNCFEADVIMIISLKYRFEAIKELSSFIDTRVIDLYDEFIRVGLTYYREFYINEYSQDDFTGEISLHDIKRLFA